MKLLVVSDIHANWPALQAIREDADAGIREMGLADDVARALMTILRTGKAVTAPGPAGAGRGTTR